MYCHHREVLYVFTEASAVLPEAVQLQVHQNITRHVNDLVAVLSRHR